MVQTTSRERPDVAAGILLAGVPSSERGAVLATAHADLDRLLGPSALWVPGRLLPDVPGQDQVGEDLPRLQLPDDLSPEERAAADEAWAAVLASRAPGERQFLRVRVDTPDDVRRLRELGPVDGWHLVPSLDSVGADRGFTWRWPLLVGVAPGAAADDWLAVLEHTHHHGRIFDAVPYDGQECDIVLADLDALRGLDFGVQGAIAACPCVIAVGDRPADVLLGELMADLAPAVAVAFAGHPNQWWQALLFEMSHDSPIDVAVELTSRVTGVDALLAGPGRGLDITAPMRWFAAAAQTNAELARQLPGIDTLDWNHEDGGAGDTSDRARAERGQGADPAAVVPGAEAAMAADAEPPPMEEMEDPGPAEEIEPEPPAAPPEPRRLVVRVRDGETVVRSVLPPRTKLQLLVRVAIPQADDVAGDRVAPELPETPDEPGPTVELDVVVRGSVWKKPPASRPIVISREKTDQASTWAAFEFTTPADGEVVRIEVALQHRGKRLQAATYVAPVRTTVVDPEERPTLTVHNVSGPDVPTGEPQPDYVPLDGTGLELIGENNRRVPIDKVQTILNTIEERVSRVTADPRAPETLDSTDARKLLIDLARIGVQLRRLLEPLDLDGAAGINITVSNRTPVLPLELAYAGPAPVKDKARLCDHVDAPPPPGEGCDRVSAQTVCPYAFWGLNRAVTRSIQWDGPLPQGQDEPGGHPFSVLYASTSIADVGADAPLPGDQVLAAAKQVFGTVTRVKTWGNWRKKVDATRPRLMVILGHSVVIDNDAKLFIGKDSSLAGVDLTGADLRVPPSPPPLVLLIACQSLAIGSAFGTLPGLLTSEGAGAVVGTLATITGPAGATATVHLLEAYQEAARTQASVGDMVARARRTLLAEKRLMGLILVSHGEVDTKVAL